jgi:hypothetical protein
MPAEKLEVVHHIHEYAARFLSTSVDKIHVSPLTGDASTRQYFRVIIPTGPSYVVARYPERIDPVGHPFCQVTRLLQAASLPVPEIFDVDGEGGFMLQEDLGDRRLQDWLMTADPAQRKSAYQEAIDLILQIQDATSLAVEMDCVAAHLGFDVEKLGWELGFFYTNFFERYLECSPEERLKTAIFGEFSELARQLAAAPRVLCHRDFHSRNLMVHKGRQYVIDHQDARMGPVSYDLASLLGDPYVELEDEFLAEMLDSFVSLKTKRSSLSGPEWHKGFEAEYPLMLIQRLLKATGTYSYQMAVMNNAVYLPYIPRALHGAVSMASRHNLFPAIREAIDRYWHRS